MKKNYYKLMIKIKASYPLIVSTVGDADNELLELLKSARYEYVLLNDVLFLYYYSRDKINLDEMNAILGTSYINVEKSEYPSVLSKNIDAGLAVSDNIFTRLIGDIYKNLDRLPQDIKVYFLKFLDYFDFSGQEIVVRDNRGYALGIRYPISVNYLPLREYLNFIDIYLNFNENMERYLVKNPYHGKIIVR